MSFITRYAGMSRYTGGPRNDRESSARGNTPWPRTLRPSKPVEETFLKPQIDSPATIDRIDKRKNQGHIGIAAWIDETSSEGAGATERSRLVERRQFRSEPKHAPTAGSDPFLSTTYCTGGYFVSFLCNDLRCRPSSFAACETLPPQSVKTLWICSHSTRARDGTVEDGTTGTAAQKDS